MAVGRYVTEMAVLRAQLAVTASPRLVYGLYIEYIEYQKPETEVIVNANSHTKAIALHSSRTRVSTAENQLNR